MSTLVDRELEQRLMGAIIDGVGWDLRATKRGLRPSHLAGEAMQATLTAVLALQDRSEPVDRLLVRGELHRLGMNVDDAAAITKNLPIGVDIWQAAALDAYVDQVRDLARRRNEAQAALMLIDAAETDDHDKRAQALALLDEAENGQAAQTHMTAEQLADLVTAYLQQPEETREPEFQTPWPTITRSLDGGLRRGEFAIVAGHTSHGKSIVVDGLLDTALSQGFRCGLYMSEMTHLQRALRLAAAHSRTGLSKLRRRALNERDWPNIIDALGKISGMPLGVINAADMTVEDVCRDIRRAKWDLAVVDHMHDFPYRDERDLAEMTQRFRSTAKASATEHAGTALVVAAQMNEKAYGDGKYPAAPTLRGIKGSAAIKQAADVVLLTYLADGGDGDPGLDGTLRLAKNRDAQLARCDMHLVPATMGFVEGTELRAA